VSLTLQTLVRVLGAVLLPVLCAIRFLLWKPRCHSLTCRPSQEFSHEKRKVVIVLGTRTLCD
jgi:hypothetical protein